MKGNLNKSSILTHSLFMYVEVLLTVSLTAWGTVDAAGIFVAKFFCEIVLRRLHNSVNEFSNVLFSCFVKSYFSITDAFSCIPFCSARRLNTWKWNVMPIQNVATKRDTFFIFPMLSFLRRLSKNYILFICLLEYASFYEKFPTCKQTISNYNIFHQIELKMYSATNDYTFCH